jgi:ribonuclease inhibitor
MPIKSCTLDGGTIKSLDDVYDALARQLDLPRHFGRNLDALYDVLSTDVAGPIKITWKCPQTARAVLGDQYDKITAVLKAVARERKDVTLLIK